MHIVSNEVFVTAAFALIGIALVALVVSAGVAFRFFSRNHRVRTARHEPLVGYYRQLAFN